MTDQTNPSSPSQFSHVCNELVQLHSKKNHDYGNAFGDTYQYFNQKGEQKMADGYAAGMLNVKINRINTLLMSENWVKNENIEDSLLDLAAYAIMYLVERRKK